MRHAIALSVALTAVLHAGLVAGKLPPPSDAAKAAAAQAAAKSAWSDKVSLYKTCLAMDRAADTYRRGLQSAGKPAPPPTPTPPCADPGAYVAPVTPEASKPIEAPEAHSPPGTATSPPSTPKTAAEIDKGK